MLAFKSEIQNIEGIYQIKIDVPFDVKFVSTYLWPIDDYYILFDAGLNMGNWDKLFYSALDEIGIPIKKIAYCIVSHCHLDHIGLIKKLKRKNPELKICMSDITNETFKWESDPNNSKQLEADARDLGKKMIKFGINENQAKRLVQWFTMWPKLRRYHEPDLILGDNDKIKLNGNNIKIIWTPGHSLGHICAFDEKQKLLFSGDHILSRITPHIGNFLIPPIVRQSYNFENILDHYLKSLNRIEKLGPNIIFPAHQEIIYNPHDRIEKIREHHNIRLKEILNLIRNEPLSPLKISQIHFGNDLDEINSYLALSEVIAHLIYLENQNQVKRIEKNGKYLFGLNI